MLRLKDGDEAAFAEIVENYQHRLIGFFVHLVGDRAVAEDFAQELFLQIYRARNGYEPTARFSTYVFRIADSLTSNRRRSQKRSQEAQAASEESDAGNSRPAQQRLQEKPDHEPAGSLDRSEIRQRVNDALQTLDDRQRMALLLHKLEDLGYADVADAMQLSPAVVKSLLARARENLRTKLESCLT